jgi:Uncharacterized protein conserved in bacteria
MLKNVQKENSDRQMVDSLVGRDGIKTVEVLKSDTPYGTTIRITLYAPDHEITTDELAAAHMVLQPRYSLLLGDRDLEMEVSSPGLQRNFKDYYEFEVFQGKCVRIYSDKYSSWIIGTIEKAENEVLTLKSAVVEDTKEEFDVLSVPYASIQKAKLEFRWEDK